VCRFFTLVAVDHSLDQQAGLKHLTVVGRCDTTGPLAEIFNYIVHVDKGAFIMANLLIFKVQKSIFHNLEIEY